MHDITIGDFLERLAAKVPAPGGGAAAALHAAQAAALLAMVGRYSQSPKYASHAKTIERIVDEADERRAEALQLAEEDAVAFQAVSQAYRLPAVTPEEKAAREQAVQAALVEAARPPAAVVANATRLVELAEELLQIGNPNLLADVAAAAAAARSLPDRLAALIGRSPCVRPPRSARRGRSGRPRRRRPAGGRG